MLRSQLGQAETTVQLIRRCLFETLYFLQKNSFFKKLYYFSHFVTFVDSVSLCLKVWFPWDLNVMTAVDTTATWASFPFHLAELSSFYVFFSLAVFLVLGTVVNTVYISSRLRAQGTLKKAWIARLLRAQLGVVTVFSPVFLRVFLVLLECDYFGRTDPITGKIEAPSYKSNHWEDAYCFSQARPTTVLLFILSILMILSLFLLVGYGALMHVNDPQSHSVQTRAHSRLDISVLYVNMVLSCIFYIFNDRQFHVLLPISFLCLHTPLLCFNIVFQPYYKSFMNNYRVMLQSVVVWTGLCLFIVVFLPSEQTSSNIGVTVMYLVLVVPVAVGGFHFSNKFRLRAINRALERYYVPPTDEESYEDDGPHDADAFETINQEYHSENVPSFLYSLKAAYVEVGTRFLQEHRSPEHVRAAERILLEGMMQYPQSEYLRAQYLTFLVSYRQNYNLAALRLEAFTALDFDLDLLFSLVRLHKEIDKAKQESLYGREIVGLDSISFEEVKRMNKLALKHVSRCKDLLLMLWKLLSNSVQDSNTGSDTFTPEQENRIAAYLEQLHQSEVAAERSFHYILQRCQNASAVYKSYATFFREVKYDREAAREMKTRARAVSSSSSQDDESSQSSYSGMSMSLQQQEQKNDLLRSRLVRKLKLKLRSVSLLLFLIVVAMLVFFLVYNDSYVDTFLSLSESGARRVFSQSAMLQSRSMHLAALDNNDAAFSSAQSTLNEGMDGLYFIQQQLAHKYQTLLPRQQDWLHTPSIEVLHSTPMGLKKEVLTGYSVITQYISMGRTCANASMQHFQAFDHLDPETFPEYFWIQQNSHGIVRSLDLSTTLYQLETQHFASDLRTLLIVLAAGALTLEIIVVIGVFRSSVSHLFKSFHSSICQLKEIDTSAIWTLVDLLSNEESEEEDVTDHVLDPRFNNPLPPRSASSAGSRSGSRSPAFKSPRSSFVERRSSTVRFKEQEFCNLSGISRDGFVDNITLAHQIQVVISDCEPTSASFENTPSLSSAGFLFEDNFAVSDVEDEAVSDVEATIPLGGEASSYPEELLPHHHEADTAAAAHHHHREDPISLEDTAISNREDPISLEDTAISHGEEPIFLDDAARSRAAAAAEAGALEEAGEEAAVSRMLEEPIALGGRAIALRDEANENINDSESPVPIDAPLEHAVGTSAVENDGIDSFTKSPSVQSYGRRRSMIRPGKRRKDPQETFVLPMAERRKKKATDLALDDSASETAKSAASSKSEQLAELESQTSRSSRRRHVTIIYTACLIASVLSLFALVMLGVFNIQPANPASEINNSGRRSFLSERMNFLTRELMLSQTTRNLLGGAISYLNSTDYIRCLLSQTVKAMLSVHFGLITGKNSGWIELPASRGWDIYLPSSPCSPLLDDPELFELSQFSRGSLGTSRRQDTCTFQANCLTDLPSDEHSITLVHDRIVFFSEPFSRQKCIYFDSGDHVTSNGLHSFIDLMTRAALNVAIAPETKLNEKNPHYLFFEKYSNSDEWNLGLVKSMLIYQATMLDRNRSNFIVLLSICAFVIIIVFSQHSILEKRIELLMQENLAMTFIIQRLMRRAGEVQV